MAKGRMIDREISDSRKIARLPSDTHRMAYAFILPHVDREGRMEADPVLISGQVFTRLAHMDHTTVAECLLALADVGLIDLYEAEDGTPVLQIVKFLEHNTPHHKEPPSKFPPPPGKSEAVADANSDGGRKHDSSMAQAWANVEPTLPPTSPIIEVKETKEKERKPPLPPQRAEAAPPPTEGEILSGIVNENPIQRLKRIAPAVHREFDELVVLQRTSFPAKLAQAKTLLERVEARGADAVAASLRRIRETAGDGGPLFTRALAHLDRQKVTPIESEDADDVTGADLLDLDAPLGGKWGRN